MMRGTFCDWILNNGMLPYRTDTVIIQADSAVNHYDEVYESDVDDGLTLEDFQRFAQGFNEYPDLEPLTPLALKDFKNITCVPMFGSIFVEWDDEWRRQAAFFIRDDADKFSYSVIHYEKVLDDRYTGAYFGLVLSFNTNGSLNTYQTYDIDSVGERHLHGEVKSTVDVPAGYATISDFVEIIVKALYALSMLHKKAEVELVDYPRNYRRRVERETGKEPSPYFRIIAPGKTVKQNVNPSQSTGNSIKLPLHTVRGHFRHVENHPIEHFNGTFWIAAHTRGDEKLGKLQKHYKIRLPEKDSVAS